MSLLLLGNTRTAERETIARDGEAWNPRQDERFHVNNSSGILLLLLFQIIIIIIIIDDTNISTKRGLYIISIVRNSGGRDSSVDIATRYGLDDPGIESL